MSQRSYDAIVVGAGIVGASSAYFLARAGLNVAIVERAHVAAGASGFAFGMVSQPFVPGPNAPAVERLLARSVELHHGLPTELESHGGGTYHSVKKAGVRLAMNEAEAHELKRIGVSGFRSDAANDPDRVDLRWLEYGALSHIEARISEDIPGGLYIGGQLEIAPDGVTKALVAAAEQCGTCTVLTGEVSAIEIENGVVQGVKLNGESLSARHVVLAAGPWCGGLLARSPGAAWVKLPIEPLKGQIVRFDISPGIPMPVSLWWGSDYAATKPDGLLYAGTTEERVGFDAEPTAEACSQITDSISRVLPFLASAPVAHQTACLRPVTPDGLPVIGTFVGVDGLVVATGGGRSGIELGPGMGELAALHTLDPGEVGRRDMGMLGPGRFVGQGS